MSATTWHADPRLLRAYVEGRLDAALSASLERHVDACAHCRAQVGPLVEGPVLEQAWSGIRSGIESGRLPLPVRLAQRLGLSEPTGILLAATASLRLTWLVGGLVTLAFVTLATVLADGAALWPFLLVAPLVPVLGVAVSYGSSEEPFEALAVTTPYGRTRLIMVRTIAVLTLTLPAAALLGLTLPGPAWVAVAWLGPALAMVSLLLALASLIGPRLAAPLLSLAWAGFVAFAVREFPSTWPVEATQQVAYLALAVLAAAVLWVRSQRTQQIGVAL